MDAEKVIEIADKMLTEATKAEATESEIIQALGMIACNLSAQKAKRTNRTYGLCLGEVCDAITSKAVTMMYSVSLSVEEPQKEKGYENKKRSRLEGETS